MARSGNAGKEVDVGLLPADDFQNSWWDLLHGGRSLSVSAFAAIVLVVVEWVESGPNPLRVYGTLGVYVVGVFVFAAMERRNYRRRRASLPEDRTGGGRLGLIALAVVFAAAGGDAAAGLAVWAAFAALVVGAMADGAWIALVAERRGIGLWRAWWVLVRREREARRQCWTALFGGSGR